MGTGPVYFVPHTEVKNRTHDLLRVKNHSIHTGAHEQGGPSEGDKEDQV